MNRAHFIVRLNWVDCVTLSGCVLGFVSIYNATQGKISTALGWLFLGVLADAFDGVLARKFGTERPFGRYLDSFVDCAIYLAAPCVILFQLGFQNLIELAVMLVFVLCGLIRLSVFNEIGNVKEGGKLSYLGLPVFWSAFLVAAVYSVGTLVPSRLSHIVVPVIMLLYAYLMLKNSAFYKPKNKILMLSVVLALSAYYFFFA